jgi:hypothetical protein
MIAPKHPPVVILHAPDGSTIQTFDNGSVEYRNGSGSLHREDGPAFISKTVTSWWRYGALHNEDGPAVINHNPILKEMWCLRGVAYKSEMHMRVALANMRRDK